MLLTQILRTDSVKVPLESTEKTACITELVELLAANGLLSDKQMALDAVLAREKTRSTGIGSAVAIPHGKCLAVKELVMAIGIARDSIDFESIDGKPVKIVLLLISPPDQTGPHIKALASISRLMLDENFKSSMEQAESAEKLYEHLSKKEQA